MDLLFTLIWSTHSYEDRLEYCPPPLALVLLVLYVYFTNMSMINGDNSM